MDTNFGDTITTFQRVGKKTNLLWGIIFVTLGFWALMFTAPLWANWKTASIYASANYQFMRIHLNK